jgi:hypothetical protein
MPVLLKEFHRYPWHTRRPSSATPSSGAGLQRSVLVQSLGDRPDSCTLACMSGIDSDDELWNQAVKGTTTPSPSGKYQRPIANGDDWKDAAEPITTIINAYINHPGIGTILLGAFLVLKGFVLSKGDIPIALGILQNAGLPTVVVGGLLSGLPILVAAMMAATIFRFFTGKSDGDTSSSGRKKIAHHDFPISPLIAVLLATVVLSAIFTQWPVMVAAVAIGTLTALTNDKNVKWWIRRAWYVAALFITIFAVISMLYTVWLPHEKLTITGVKPSPIGYVLADDPDGWITILLSRQHGIVSYRDIKVTARQVCEQTPYNFWSHFTAAPTLWQEITNWRPLIFLHPAAEPPCFKPGKAA